MHRKNMETTKDGYLWVMVFQVDFFFLLTLFLQSVIAEITRYFVIGKIVNIRVICDS